MPANAAYVLRPMVPADAKAVQQLWSRRFGGASSTQENWLDATLAPDHSAIATVAVSSPRGEVVGFGMLEVGDEAYTRRYLSLNTLDLNLPLDAHNGLFHMYCVRADWEGKGIGSALFAHHLRILAEREVPRAFGIAWHRPHTVDSRSLFEKHEFTCLVTVERYYDRCEDRAHCPDCGDVCTCTASFYARDVEGGPAESRPH